MPEPEPEPEPSPLSRLLSSRLSVTQSQKLRIALPELRTTEMPSTLPTTLQRSFPSRRTNILNFLEESFSPFAPTDDQFKAIIPSLSAANPWDIDTTQFEIVPAVPSDDEKVSDDENNVDTRQFNPVPAVPEIKIDDKQTRQPKNILSLSDEVENNIDEEKALVEDISSNGSCLDKCVQQFCLLEEDLSLFSNCVGKCKTFCY